LPYTKIDIDCVLFLHFYHLPLQNVITELEIV